MKHVKKLVSLLLVMIVVFAMATTTFAEGANSITVNGAQKDETYKLYKMLDLSVDETNTAYSYTVNSNWTNFFTNSGSGAEYVSIDPQGYVTWKEGKGTASDMEDFAKAAAAFASAHSLDPVVDAIIPNEDGAITFDGLESGYYLITSTNGTLAIVDTTPTDPDANVYEKNVDSTLDKKVQEDSQSEAEGNGWGTGNSAQIGDTINFQVSITLKKGAKNVVMHDKMEDGLSFNVDSVAIAGLTKGTEYTVVTTGLTDGCTFEIRFEQYYLDSITSDTPLAVTYNAVLDENADITNGEKNDAKLTWGKNSYTEWRETVTKTFMFDIIKTDSSMKVLNGAKFELYDAQTAGNKIDLVKVSDGVYRIATAAEKSAEGFTSAVIEAGKATVKGLDANTTYWLKETEAPAGYNKLADRVEVKIENSNLTTNMTGDTWMDGDGGVQITNKTGIELPSTGGMGTTVFYVVGSILVIGAAVLLITRKRMSNKR